RIDLQLEAALSALEGLAPQRIDLRDVLVGHGIAAPRGAVAMDHQIRSGTAPRPVELVRKPGVEGEIIVRIRVHQPRRDRIEALRRLPVALLELRAQLTRPGADLVLLEELVGAA